MYVLNIDPETNRILSAWVEIPGQDYTGLPIVEEKPDDSDGKWVSDYLYVDGAYIYDPVPRPEPPEPTPSSENLTTDEMATAIMEGVNAV